MHDSSIQRGAGAANQAGPGGCLCGAVRFEIRAAIDALCHCHCTMCRKAHGAAFATYTEVPRSVLRFTQGEDALRSYRSSPAALRRFCSICGSSLLWESPGEFPDTVFVAAATLDSPVAPASQRHIHVSDKASWYEITDSWPRGERY